MNATKVRHHVGIDISARDFHVVIDDAPPAKFDNNAAGHAACLKAITKRAGRVRVVVEATSTYHVDLCLVLASSPRCEVMVANPRHTHAFTQAQGRRAKTDAIDAAVLRDFARVMPFVQWTPPTPEALELRSLTRYLDQLTRDRTALKNQRHALKATATSSDHALLDLAQRILDITSRMKRAEAKLAQLKKAHASIRQHVDNLTTIPGVGELTALRLVAEFLVLDHEMTSKQLAAWAGLDPRPRESGTSVRGKRKISKRGNARVRHALYMPALSISQRKNAFAVYYSRIAGRAAAKMIAITATMRKMLVVAWALFRSNTTYDETRVIARQDRP